jgi:hypothetical protein
VPIPRRDRDPHCVLLEAEAKDRNVGSSKQVPTFRNILHEAETIVYGPREHDYGHPRDDFARTWALWQPILASERTGPEKVALCMVQVKVAREINRPKRDNRVDGCGYFATLDRLTESEK